MTRFLSKELYNEVDDLIERLDALRGVLKDARDTTSYENFDNFMEDAYLQAHSISYDIDALREAGDELYSNEEEDEDEEDEEDEY